MFAKKKPALTTETKIANGMLAEKTASADAGDQAPPKLLFNYIPWSGRTGLFFKGMFATVGLIAILMALILISMLTSIDTVIIKPSLHGTILDQDNNPISGASVLLDGEEAVSDSNGTFLIGNLNISRYTIEISASGYQTLKREVAVSRSFLNYTTSLIFKLSALGMGEIRGKMVVSDPPNYNFADDRIVVGEQEFRIAPDGTFLLEDIETGPITFHFKSANYRDVITELDLTSAGIDLGDIPLFAAGDIVGSLKSFLREEIVSDLQIAIEGVPAEFLSVDENGNFRIRDLETARSYRVRITHPNYVDRDYEVGIQQGENQLFGFKVVENYRVPYLKRVNNEFQIFASDLDGKNEKQLTEQQRLEIYGEYLDGNTVYFISTRDNLRAAVSGGKVGLVYSVGIGGGNPQRVTSEYVGLGQVLPNFKAKLLSNVRVEGTSGNYTRVLEVMDMAGNNRETVYSGAVTFTGVQISDNGKFVSFAVQDPTGDRTGLYRWTKGSEPQRIATRANIKLIAISPNGNRVLYSGSGEGGLSDLYLYTVNAGQDKLVQRAFTGVQQRFLGSSDDLVIYYANRDGGSNVYLLDLARNTDTKLTNFSGTEGVEAVYQQPGIIMYQTNRGLYVMDVDKRLPGKFTTTDVARYTGYDY